MPLFRKANVLLIHIPKTGGSSIEDYFFSKYREKCTIQNLLVRYEDIKLNGHSPQHCTYSELYKMSEILDLNFDELEIISCVRNPYHRIISDLFFFNILDHEDTPDIVFQKIKNYLESENEYDNHKRKQIDYLLYEGKIDPKIKIFKIIEIV